MAALTLTLDTASGFGGANTARATYTGGAPGAGDTISNAELDKLTATAGIGTNMKSFLNTVFTDIAGGANAATQAAAAAKALRLVAVSAVGALPSSLAFTCVSGAQPTATITTSAAAGEIVFATQYSASR